MQLNIKGIVKYVIPTYGNKRTMPYGKLLVEVNGAEKVIDIKRDNIGMPFITFNRKRHYIRNIGSLYNPAYEVCDYE